LSRTTSHNVSEYAKCDLEQDGARQCEGILGGTGLEHHPLTLSKTAISENASAKSDARDAPETKIDPDLAQIIWAWPKLSDSQRQRICRLIEQRKPSSSG
jgi:hypothetical protein